MHSTDQPSAAQRPSWVSLLTAGAGALLLLVFALAACTDPIAPEYTNSHDALAPGYLPGTPTGLTISIGSESSRTLRWTRTSVGESGYRVERKLLPAGQYVRIGDVPAGAASYIDTTTIVTDTTYFYRISALNASGGARGFDSTRFRHVFAPPFGIRVDSENPEYARLAWSDTSRIATAFIVEGRTREEDYREFDRIPADSLSCTVRGLDTTTDYQFRVRGVTTSNQSRPGEPIGVFFIPVQDSQVVAVDLGYGSPIMYGGSIMDARAFLSPDGSLGIAIGNGPVTVMQTTTGTPVQTFNSHFFSTVAFSGDNAYMAAACEDANVRIYRLSDGAQISSHYFAPPIDVTNLALDHDGTRLAVRSSRRFWVLGNSSGHLLFLSPEYPGGFSGNIALTPDGTAFACLPGMFNAQVWDLSTWTLRSSMTTQWRSFFVAFGPKSLLAVGAYEGVKFYNYETGAEVAPASVAMEPTALEGAFDAEGRCFYYEHQKLRQVDLEGVTIARTSDGRVLREIPAIAGERPAQHIAMSSAFGHRNTLVKVDTQNRVLIRHMTTCWIQHEW